MKVRLRLVGFPGLVARLGSDQLPVEIDGATVGDLLLWLQRNHGDPAQIQLLDAHGGASAAGAGGAGAVDAAGHLHPDLVLLRDGQAPVPHDDLQQTIRDGDQLTLMVVVAGG